MTAYVVSEKSASRRHDLTHSPLVLYQFDGDLSDSGGSGWDMTVEAGTERYSDVVPGVRGILLRSTRLIYNTFQAALAITGDYTAEMLVNFIDLTTVDRWLFSFGGAIAGETEDDNYLYAGLLATGPVWRHFSESSTGTDATYSIDDLPPFGQAAHLAARRASGVVQWFVNGAAFGAASSALTTPTTSGTSARLRIGADSRNAPDCVLASFKLIDSALTADEIKGEYNLTLGSVFGFRG
jgi:hypothetical protein